VRKQQLQGLAARLGCAAESEASEAVRTYQTASQEALRCVGHHGAPVKQGRELRGG